jgi:hypothetical protein
MDNLTMSFTPIDDAGTGCVSGSTVPGSSSNRTVGS